jgi:MFS family permease
MMETDLSNQEAPAPRAKISGVIVNVISTLLASMAMGMLAVLVPVQLAELKLNDATIGNILSFETLAAIAICLALPRILTALNLKVGLLLSAVIRVPAIFLFPFFDNIAWLAFAIFLHGIGFYCLLILMQTWINSIPIKKNKGLIVSLYSTAVSVGFAIGPIFVNFSKANPQFLSEITQPIEKLLVDIAATQPLVTNTNEFIIAAFISACSLLPYLIRLDLVPNVKYSGGANIWSTIGKCKGAMFSVAAAAVSQFGVAAFITLYGLKNGLSLADSALLLSAFMFGSLFLEVPIAWLSDYFDRRYFIVMCCFACIVCAVYLPIAIYTPIQAWILVFIWGGVIAAIYSMSLALIGEKYTREDDIIVANAGYTLMESVGGTLGIIAIGFSMQFFGTDGMPYVVMLASVLYFSFALTRFRIE